MNEGVWLGELLKMFEKNNWFDLLDESFDVRIGFFKLFV
jgi:hypothetical protein